MITIWKALFFSLLLSSAFSCQPGVERVGRSAAAEPVVPQAVFATLPASMATPASALRSEDDYIRMLNENYFHGETEVRMRCGRADIVNERYAIEVEFAPKWKNGIGQALCYGMESNKQPTIVLVKKPGYELKHNKYAIMLRTTLDYGGLHKVKVLVWPDDF